ncbi:dihydrofolate reductase [Negadavirga shengliensis]|uniref:Dihydrofolate reductase n=1 Tax=Negadavirga shengliensis TaxID=1389218 RepID=A0ABV9T2H6_9BACT
MKISIIVAKAKNNAIGLDGRLPWHLPSDLKHFKKTTSGHHVILGRKTFESLGKPLPGRTHIIVTKNKNFTPPPGQYVAHSIEDAINIAKSKELDRIFILGGAEIYKLALPLADEMIITEIETLPEADTFFPEFDREKWQIKSREHVPKDDQNKFDHAFVTYIRKNAKKHHS